MGLELSRRSLVHAGAWSAPVVLAGTAVPVYAASSYRIEMGLFVSTQDNGGVIGYATSNNSGALYPKTPVEYFAATADRRQMNQYWNDATGQPTAVGSTTTPVVNGEGSFTPVTNSASGVDGAYASTSGFWFSVPVESSQAYTGSGYLPAGTATLVGGAVFKTVVEFETPDIGVTQRVKIVDNRTLWNQSRSGRVTYLDGSNVRGQATYLDVAMAEGTWVTTVPTVTQNPSTGNYVFRAEITFTTSATRAMKITQTGTKYYGQVHFMPGIIDVEPNIVYYSQTSWVEQAVITYAANGVTGSVPVSGLTTTSRLTIRN